MHKSPAKVDTSPTKKTLSSGNKADVSKSVEVRLADMPKHHNQKFGSYTGFYSKTYLPAYDGTLEHRRVWIGNEITTLGKYVEKQVQTRTENNQRGTDADYDQTIPRVHSPVKFEKQRKRQVFHRRDGVMHAFANENRFKVFNDLPKNRTKHITYQSPAFEKWAEHSLDEFIQKTNGTTNENASQ